VDHREFQHQVEQGDARWAGSEHASAVSFYRMALNRASGVFFPAYRYEESFDPRRAELEELQDRARSRVELWEELRRPSRRPRPSPSTADSA
jgi:hypothetical protein